jgi:hypothetical protein
MRVEIIWNLIDECRNSLGSVWRRSTHFPSIFQVLQYTPIKLKNTESNVNKWVYHARWRHWLIRCPRSFDASLSFPMDSMYLSSATRREAWWRIDCTGKVIYVWRQFAYESLWWDGMSIFCCFLRVTTKENQIMQLKSYIFRNLVIED